MITTDVARFKAMRQRRARKPRSMACPGACCLTLVLGSTSAQRLENEAADHPKGEAASILDLWVPSAAYSYDTNGGESRVWQCTSFDGKRCRTYAIRPGVCSAYPYERACHICVYRDGAYHMREPAAILTKLGYAGTLETGLFEPLLYDLLTLY